MRGWFRLAERSRIEKARALQSWQDLPGVHKFSGLLISVFRSALFRTFRTEPVRSGRILPLQNGTEREKLQIRKSGNREFPDFRISGIRTERNGQVHQGENPERNGRRSGRFVNPWSRQFGPKSPYKQCSVLGTQNTSRSSRSTRFGF